MNGILTRRYSEGEIILPSVGIKGRYKWELKRAGKVIRDSGGWHENLITNTGMNSFVIQDFPTQLAYANVGTSAVAPAFTDVALGAEVATAVRPRVSLVASTYVAGPPDYWYRRNQYTWTETFANGNLTEFGIFDPAHNLIIRQLLKDGVGAPTVIIKTNLDQLIITHEYRIYVPIVDVASVVVISGVNYDVVTRPTNANSAFGWAQVLGSGFAGLGMPKALETNVLAVRTSTPGDGIISTNGAATAYVPGNFYIENQCEWQPGFANFPTGIGMITSFSSAPGGSGANDSTGMFQHQFTPKIPKINTQKLTLFVRRSWARYP
jgi:hypothetical protein